MSTIERIEYYSSCPSCGASSEGQDVCPYCGGSMIKRRYSMESDLSYEDAAAQEDFGLPVIEGKLCGEDKFLKIFCPLFGGIFLLVPTFLFVIFASTGLLEPWLIAFFGLFWIIGICAFVPLALSVVRKNKVKNGRVVTGIVRSYESGNFMVNNEPVQNMRIRLNDNGKESVVVLSTGNPRKPYPLGAKISLRTVDDLYMIL